MSHVAQAKPGQRYRESFGRHYEEFNVGDIYEHRPGRTITETDNVWFTLLTMNKHPLHFDNAYAAKTEFGRPLVNSCLTLSMVVGMSVSDVSQKAIGNLGWNDIRLTAPVFVGDTIYAESTVLAYKAYEIEELVDVYFYRRVGYLIARSHFLPRAIGVLLLLGGAAFLITSFTNFLSPQLGDRLAPPLLPIVLLGEASLALWLLLRGVNVEQWRSAVARRATINPAAINSSGAMRVSVSCAPPQRSKLRSRT